MNVSRLEGCLGEPYEESHASIFLGFFIQAVKSFGDNSLQIWANPGANQSENDPKAKNPGQIYSGGEFDNQRRLFWADNTQASKGI